MDSLLAPILTTSTKSQSTIRFSLSLQEPLIDHRTPKVMSWLGPMFALQPNDGNSDLTFHGPAPIFRSGVLADEVENDSDEPVQDGQHDAERVVVIATLK